MTEEQYRALVREEQRRVLLHAAGGPPYVRVMDDPDFLRSVGIEAENP
jgi:hypothetical protein